MASIQGDTLEMECTQKKICLGQDRSKMIEVHTAFKAHESKILYGDKGCFRHM